MLILRSCLQTNFFSRAPLTSAHALHKEKLDFISYRHYSSSLSLSIHTMVNYRYIVPSSICTIRSLEILKPHQYTVEFQDPSQGSFGECIGPESIVDIAIDARYVARLTLSFSVPLRYIDPFVSFSHDVDVTFFSILLYSSFYQ